MRKIGLAVLSSLAAAPALAQETRELGAHVHGVSIVELAVEGSQVEITLRAPGSDIVGFEYAARTEADKAAVDAAVAALRAPENVVAMPEAAGCRLTEAAAELEVEDGHDHDHDHDDDHAQDDHGHDEDHAHDDDHGHEDTAEGKAGEAMHSEFHAHYVFDCASPENLATIGFPFFERFANAKEIEVRYVTETGAGMAEVTRDVAELTLDRQ